MAVLGGKVCNEKAKTYIKKSQSIVPRCVSLKKLSRKLERWMERIVKLDEALWKQETPLFVYRNTVKAPVLLCTIQCFGFIDERETFVTLKKEQRETTIARLGQKARNEKTNAYIKKPHSTVPRCFSLKKLSTALKRWIEVAVEMDEALWKNRNCDDHC